MTAAGSQSSASTVGIIVNPAAGKDIRRLVSAASPTSDMAKVGIVRRAVIGAIEGGAERVLLSDDRRSLSARAIDRLDTEAELDLLPTPPWDVGRNSTVAAMLLRDEEVGAVIVLGGDGTHRDVVKGWRHAPLVALSTGTNNVFPRHYEATVAGHAAAVVATGVAQLDDVSWQAKVLDVEVGATDDAEAEADLALVDLAHVDSSFTASRAVWEAG
ncbi:MAG: NAD(+)/NADH kinase, partial [Actinomycetota bacterium]|nr:NAD(+)/NADH kinase [Actinomycetota bacterium]